MNEAHELLMEMRERKVVRAVLAEALGINVSTVSRKLHGQRDFTLGEFKEVCALLGVSPAEIMERAERGEGDG